MSKQTFIVGIDTDKDTFEEWIKEHNAKVRANAIEEVERAMYHQSFNVDHEEDGLQKWDSGNWVRYKLFENVIKQLKEHKNE